MNTRELIDLDFEEEQQEAERYLNKIKDGLPCPTNNHKLVIGENTK